jgi:nucleoid DNA-binding protein
MATTTKRDLISNLGRHLAASGRELSQSQILAVIEALIEELGASLEAGDQVVLRNFGAFQVRELKAKVDRNPKVPGKDIHIPARAVVRFKPGKDLKERVAKLSTPATK